MKSRIQEKELKQAAYLIKIYNGELEYLLNYCEPFAYVSSRSGWKYDVYNPDGSCIYISRGYAPIGWRVPDDEKWILKALDDKAWSVRGDDEAVSRLLKLFIDYCFYSLVPLEYAGDSKSEVLEKIKETTR